MATTAKVGSGRLKAFLAAHRTLKSYPVGAQRWWMLVLTVFASIVSFYEFGFSAMVPLWLPALHFSAEEFGWFVTGAVFVSGLSAMAGGPLADRHGRVLVIDVGIGVMVVLTFCNLFMTGFWSFVMVRGLMNLVASLTWGALGGLTRDMSPRVSRGAAFGLLMFGPLVSLWLWNFVPAMTLPYFHSWQSQVVIMGIVAIFLYVPVLLWLKDLSPELRLNVIDSESVAEAFVSGDVPHAAPASAMSTYRQLLRHWEIWVLVLGLTAFITGSSTMANFGPLIFERAFAYSHAAAAKEAANYFLFYALMLVPGGFLSDWLRVRKPLVLLMTLIELVILAWWVHNFYPPLSETALGRVMLLFGCLSGLTLVPWCAFYSEYLEDLSPALQATGWSFYQLITRAWTAVAAPLQLAITNRIAASDAVARHLAAPDQQAWSIAWKAWMDVAVAGAFLMVVAMLAVRGYWRPTASSAGRTDEGEPVPAPASARPA
jgi:MFS family permease